MSLIIAAGKNGRGGWIRTNAWQDQNLLPYRLATPLYRVPHSLPSYRFELAMQRRPIAAASDEARQGGRKLARDFISIGLVWEAPKHASSGSGHLCCNKFVERYQSVTHFGVALLDNRLAVVTTAPLGKAANCNGGGITCQLGVGKNFRGTDADLRNGDQEPGFGQLHRLQLLAHALGEGRAAAHEYRHVGAQGQTQRGQALFS